MSIKAGKQKTANLRARHSQRNFLNIRFSVQAAFAQDALFRGICPHEPSEQTAREAVKPTSILRVPA